MFHHKAENGTVAMPCELQFDREANAISFRWQLPDGSWKSTHATPLSESLEACVEHVLMDFRLDWNCLETTLNT